MVRRHQAISHTAEAGPHNHKLPAAQITLRLMVKTGIRKAGWQMKVGIVSIYQDFLILSSFVSVILRKNDTLEI